MYTRVEDLVPRRYARMSLYGTRVSFKRADAVERGRGANI
jgi:hypothetical protein